MPFLFHLDIHAVLYTYWYQTKQKNLLNSYVTVFSSKTLKENVPFSIIDGSNWTSTSVFFLFLHCSYLVKERIDTITNEQRERIHRNTKGHHLNVLSQKEFINLSTIDSILSATSKIMMIMDSWLINDFKIVKILLHDNYYVNNIVIGYRKKKKIYSQSNGQRTTEIFSSYWKRMIMRISSIDLIFV